jgi:hypothetical protein
MHTRLSRLALVALGGLLAMSCRSSTEPVALPAATFRAQWQGQDWAGKARATLWRDTLYVSGVRTVTDGNGSYEEAVQVRVAFHGVGRYVLDSAAVSMLEIVGGDGVFGSYYGVGANAGVLDVTTYGGPGATVEGTVRFDARRSRTSNPIYHFDDGRFSASVDVPPQ